MFKMHLFWLLSLLMGGVEPGPEAPVAGGARRRAKRERGRAPRADDPFDTVCAERGGFDPRLIPVKPRVSAATEMEVDWWAAFRGLIEVDPAQAGLRPDKAFVARGVPMSGAPLFANCGGEERTEPSALRLCKLL